MSDETMCQDCQAAPAGAVLWEKNGRRGYDACVDCKRLDWIGHPRCENRTDENLFLIEHRQDIELIGEIVPDPDAYYEYDDFAIVRVGRKYFLVNTSGCSCPDPRETWSVVCGPLSRKDLVAELPKHVSNKSQLENLQGYARGDA